jgi:hypothetical protein
LHEREARGARRRSSGGTTGRRHASGFFIASIVLRIVFSIVSHCSCAGGFLLVLSRRCIVFRISFPIADRLYLFFPRGFPAKALDARPARCLDRGCVAAEKHSAGNDIGKDVNGIGFVRRESENG